MLAACWPVSLSPSLSVCLSRSLSSCVPLSISLSLSLSLSFLLQPHIAITLTQTQTAAGCKLTAHKGNVALPSREPKDSTVRQITAALCRYMVSLGGINPLRYVSRALSFISPVSLPPSCSVFLPPSLLPSFLHYLSCLLALPLFFLPLW